MTGESHFVQGRRYLLNVIYHTVTPKVILQHTILDLYVQDGSDAAKRQAVLQA